MRKLTVSARNRWRRARASYSAIVLVSLQAGFMAACGPELTTPSAIDLSGTWTSSDTVGGVTGFTLVLSQASDGALTGAWSGRAVELNGACQGELGCAPANNIVGSNTAFQVHIDLLSLGAFTGQAEGDARFRGHLGLSALAFERTSGVRGTRVTGSVP